MSYPRALTRAVLCMLLSLMLLACEEGGKGAPGSSGPREVVIIKLEPRREVYTTALAGRIASFQVAEVTMYEPCSFLCSLTGTRRREGGAGPVSDRSRHV